MLARRGFRVREDLVDLARVDEIRARHGFLFDRLSLRSGGRTVQLYFFRDRRRALDAVVAKLEAARTAAGAPAPA